MRIIAVTGTKGGTGRTTIAAHLAVAAGQCGKRTIILDVGTRAEAHSSMDFWRRGRQAATPYVHRVDSERQLDDALAVAAASGADIAILDHYERYTSAINYCTKHAGFVLIPAGGIPVDDQLICGPNFPPP